MLTTEARRKHKGQTVGEDRTGAPVRVKIQRIETRNQRGRLVNRRGSGRTKARTNILPDPVHRKIQDFFLNKARVADNREAMRQQTLQGTACSPLLGVLDDCVSGYPSDKGTDPYPEVGGGVRQRKGLN